MDDDYIHAQMEDMICKFEARTMSTAAAMIADFRSLLSAHLESVCIRDQKDVDEKKAALTGCHSGLDDVASAQQIPRLSAELLPQIFSPDTPNVNCSNVSLNHSPGLTNVDTQPLPATHPDGDENAQIRNSIASDTIRRLEQLVLLENKSSVSALETYVGTSHVPCVKQGGEGDPMQFVAVCEDMLRRMEGNPPQVNIRSLFAGEGGTLYDRYWRDSPAMNPSEAVSMLKHVRSNLDIRAIEKYQYQFYLCKQNGSSVKLYAADFLRLAKAAGVINFISEHEMCAVFLQGLDERIQVALRPYYRSWVLAEMIQNAVAANRFYGYLG